MSDQTTRKEKYSEIVARQNAMQQQEIASTTKRNPIENLRPISEIKRSVRNGTTKMSEAAMELSAIQEQSEKEFSQDTQMIQMQNMHALANILSRADSVIVEGWNLELDSESFERLKSIRDQVKELAFQVLLQEHALLGEMFNEQLTN